MQWPYAKNLMLIGSVSLGLLYTIRFLNKNNKSKLDHIKLAMVLLWIISYLVKAFHIFNVPYVFEIILLMLFSYWFIVEGLSYLKNRKFTKNKFLKFTYYLLIGLIIFSLFFGNIFKIQHWPYGALMFTIGVLLLSVLLIFDYFLVDRRHFE